MWVFKSTNSKLTTSDDRQEFASDGQGMALAAVVSDAIMHIQILTPKLAELESANNFLLKENATLKRAQSHM